ncbi:MAG TPA: DUF58 domain-containing protein [Nitrospinaceae bacterium]|jgi:uncharacterized protein (DUF58 family)|nr:DUF58 domain-containing protein [Nitrospinaceae bacterium]
MSFLSKVIEGFKTAPPPSKPEDITVELMQKIRSIQIKTSHIVTELMAGEYVSAFKGRGMEFNAVREYTPGDDVRLIDWNVTARMDQPFIKEYIEERELNIMLMVDVSSSGKFGSTGKFKNEISAEIASILAFAAIRNNDKIGLIVFSDKIEHYIPPKKGKAHVWNIIRTILNYHPEGSLTDLNIPLEYLLKIQKRKCIAFLISDFQATNYETNIKLTRQKHDLVAIFISDRRERDLPKVGLINLRDSESGETLLIDTNDREMTKFFATYEREKQDKLKKQLHFIGVDTIKINTEDSLVEPIIRYFKIREKRN